MAKILYIEDTENNRILITRRLAQSNYQVVTAETADQGMAVARAEMPDLILMDMGLPGVDGWSATRRFKEDPQLKHIPIIALTAHVMHGDRERALAAGCDDYDTKPFQFARLLSKIDTALTAQPSSSPAVQPQNKSRSDLLEEFVAQAQHDLRNPLAHILAFSEILLKQVQPSNGPELEPDLESLYEFATQMVKGLDRVLDPDGIPPGRDAVSALEEQLQSQALQMTKNIEDLLGKARTLSADPFTPDLIRMLDSAKRMASLIGPVLSAYPT